MTQATGGESPTPVETWTPSEKPVRGRSSALLVLNVLALVASAFALIPHIDAQIAGSHAEIEPGYEGLARVTALVMVMVGSVGAYLLIRLGAYLLEVFLTRQRADDVGLVLAVDLANFAAVALVLGAALVRLDGVAAAVVLGLAVPLTLVGVYLLPPQRRRLSPGSCLWAAAGSVVVVASHLGRI